VDFANLERAESAAVTVVQHLDDEPDNRPAEAADRADGCGGAVDARGMCAANREAEAKRRKPK